MITLFEQSYLTEIWPLSILWSDIFVTTLQKHVALDKIFGVIIFLNVFSGVKDAKNQWVYKVAYTWSTVVKAAGTKVAYDHEDYLWKDKVEIPGPTKQVLKLMVRRHQLCVLYKTLQRQKRAHANRWAFCLRMREMSRIFCVRRDSAPFVSFERAAAGL